ncbi:MAG: porin family protein [Alistipes sp.]
MKKLCITLLCLVCVCSVAAQEKHIFGLRAGLNVANLTMKMDDVSQTADSRTSFHVGGSYQYGFSQKLPFYLETGLYLSSRGSKNKEDGETTKLSLLYLQVPVLLSYHINIGKTVNIQPYAGVYYGYGISGKAKIKSDGVSTSHSVFKDVTVDGHTVDQILKRSDLGLRFGAGVGFLKHYYAGLGYDLGLTNINATSDDDKVSNGCFYISVGYTF